MKISPKLIVKWTSDQETVTWSFTNYFQRVKFHFSDCKGVKGRVWLNINHVKDPIHMDNVFFLIQKQQNKKGIEYIFGFFISHGMKKCVQEYVVALFWYSPWIILLKSHTKAVRILRTEIREYHLSVCWCQNIICGLKKSAIRLTKSSKI